MKLRTSSPLLLLLALALAFVWLTNSPYHNDLNNPNENVRVYTVRALVDHGTFAIDDVCDEWGYVNDKATFGGRLYAGKAPGSAYLAVPAYAAWRLISNAVDREPSKREWVQVCRLGSTTIPTLLMLCLFAVWALRRCEDRGAAAMIVVALAAGSLVFSYGLIMTSHSTAAMALVIALILFDLHKLEPDRMWPLVAAGFVLGWAVALEYPAALGGALIGLYGLARSPRRTWFLAWVTVGMALPIGLVLIFHASCFGGILETPYGHLENPGFIEHHAEGFYGLKRIKLNAIVGSFVSPANGLLFYAPWTALPIAAIPVGLSRRDLRQQALLTLCVLLTYAAFISLVTNWRGGWSAGARYIVPVVPVLAWYLVFVFRALARSADFVLLKGVLATTTLVGVFVCTVSATHFPHYPTDLANPVYEIGTFFAFRGYRTWGLAHSLNLAGPASILMALGAAGIAWLSAALMRPSEHLGRRVLGERILTASLCAMLASCVILLQSRIQDANRGPVDNSRNLISHIWEPRPSYVATHVYRHQLPADIIDGSASRARIIEYANAATREGFAETALDLYLLAATRPRQ